MTNYEFWFWWVDFVVVGGNPWLIERDGIIVFGIRKERYVHTTHIRIRLINYMVVGVSCGAPWRS